MYVNFRELEDGSEELDCQSESPEIEGGMPTSALGLKAGLVRKAPIVNRTAELCGLGKRGLAIDRVSKVEDRTDFNLW